MKSTRWKVLRSSPSALVGLVTLALITVAAVAAPIITPVDPQVINVRARLIAPGAEHVLGTDHLGRDLLARLLYGARVSLLVGAAVTVAASLAGIVLGLIGGYGNRVVSSITMRVIDGMMAFPGILLALALVAVLGPRLSNTIIALAVVYTPRMARVVQAAVLQAKVRDYVEAAVALGARQWRVMLRHILPTVFASILVQGTFAFAYAVIAEAGLSFLGVGAPPDIPTWGNILSTGRSHMLVAPWITLLPGIAILITVLALNLLGDGLRDIADPHATGPRTVGSQEAQ